MKKLNIFLQKTYKNILESRLFIALLSLSFGFFVGTMLISSQSFQASLLQENVEAVLEENELDSIFTELGNKKEIEISKISDKNFLVEFFATEGEGNSLHPYSFIVTKDGTTLIGVKELTSVN